MAKVNLNIPENTDLPTIIGELDQKLSDIADNTIERIVTNTTKIVKIARFVGISDNTIKPYLEIFFENWGLSFSKSIEKTIENEVNHLIEFNKHSLEEIKQKIGNKNLIVDSPDNKIEKKEQEETNQIIDNEMVESKLNSIVSSVNNVDKTIKKGDEENRKERKSNFLSKLRNPFEGMFSLKEGLDEDFLSRKTNGLFSRLSGKFFSLFEKSFAKVFANVGLLSTLSALLTPFLYRVFLNWDDIIKKEFDTSDTAEIVSKIIQNLNFGGMAASGGLAGALIGMFFGPFGALIGAAIGAGLGAVVSMIAEYFGPEKIAKYFDSLMTKEGGIGAALGGAVGMIFGPIGAAIGAIVGWLAGGIVKMFEPEIEAFKTQVSENIKNAIEGIKNFIEPIVKIFTDIYDGMGKYISNSVFMLKTGYNNISEKILKVVEIISSVTNFITDFMDNSILKLEKGVKKVVDFKDDVIKSIGEKIDLVYKVYSDFIDKIVSTFNDLVNSIKNNRVYKFFFGNDKIEPIDIKKPVEEPNKINTSGKISVNDDTSYKTIALESAAKAIETEKITKQMSIMHAAMQSVANVNNQNLSNVVNNSSTNVFSAMPSPVDLRLPGLAKP